MSRQLVVVDCETTGLHDDAVILEIAAVNVDTGEELAFVPYVTREQLAAAEPDALRINLYYERGVYRSMLTKTGTAQQYKLLRKMLEGNTFGGSNPAFDSALVAAAEYESAPAWDGLPATHKAIGKVWHHRLGDLAAYTAGVLGLDITELPGLDAVVDLIGHTFHKAHKFERHTALGDARLTAALFRQLRDWAPRNKAH